MDSPRRTVILFALAIEGAPVLAALENAREERAAGRSFMSGNIGNIPVLAAATGVGKVASALAASAAIAQFGAREIIMIGTAGALRSSLRLGDLFVASETIQHDLGVREGRRAHPCPALSKELLEIARRGSPTGRVHGGSLLTGDRGCFTYRRRLRLLWSFRADRPQCVDMESAAVGAAAQGAGVPFGILRIVSDHAGPLAFREVKKHFHDLAPVPAKVVVDWLRTSNR
ncbi:MAG: 5'-methylthioadenosine/S-adenosylhomocysteine nucleosidase [Planctomycetes bacterium]|nr:5'-methylthioadenosine/S-adenosylhomocysteine nucleosidase [Planctomycetota bacterium]